VRRRKVWQTLAVGVAVTVVTACSNNAQPQTAPLQGATVPTAAPTTTTTNPYTVPDQIDAAYVNRVLAGLDAIEGDIFREVRATKNLTLETIDRITAFHTNLATAEVLINFYQIQMGRNFTGYYETPGNRSTDVVDLIRATSSCVYASAERDNSMLGPDTTGRRPVWVALRPMPVSHVNPTGWGYQYNGVTPSGGPPTVNPCAEFS
jgi:hypothetical protein